TSCSKRGGKSAGSCARRAPGGRSPSGRFFFARERGYPKSTPRRESLRKPRARPCSKLSQTTRDSSRASLLTKFVIRTTIAQTPTRPPPPLISGKDSMTMLRAPRNHEHLRCIDRLRTYLSVATGVAALLTPLLGHATTGTFGLITGQFFD